MQKTRELAPGFLLGVIFLMVIVGGVALALAESNIITLPVSSTPRPAHTALPLSTHTLAPSVTVLIATDTVAPIDTATTLPPPPTTCPPPNGWITIIVQGDETLYTLAVRYKTTPEKIAAGNCLITPDLPTGTIIYVPPVPTVMPTACRPPVSWIIYIVQPGDNLYRLSLKYRITVAQLQRGNCMGSSQLIYAGQRLYVPNVPTSTPDVTNTPVPPPGDTTIPSPLPPSDTPLQSATPAPSPTQ